MLIKIKQPIAIVIIWFIVGLGLLCTYWAWDWQVLAGLATWVLAGGIWLAFLQVRQARRSTNAQIAVSLFQELRNPEAIEKLHSIYNLPYDLSTSEGVKELKCYEKKDIDHVLDRFDTLGVLVAEGIVDDKVAIEAYAGPPALRCWYRLHQYVKEARDKRGYFGDNYEGFVRLTLDYFHEAGVEIKLYKEDGEQKELVFKELQNPELKPRTWGEIKEAREEEKVAGDKPEIETNL